MLIKGMGALGVSALGTGNKKWAEGKELKSNLENN